MLVLSKSKKNIVQLFFCVVTCMSACGYAHEENFGSKSAIHTANATHNEEDTMRSFDLTPPGDQLLQRKSLEVPIDQISSKETQEIIESLFKMARGERDNGTEGPVMVGLAAPQIGISKRIILVDTGVDSDRKNLGTLTAFINPEITWYSDEMEEGREGCYSVDERVMGLVPRPQKIKIKAYDRHGVLIETELSGFTARIFQHEVDHLEGIRFPDRVGSEGKLHWVEEDEYLDYKKNHTTWSCKCPWHVWESMKNNQPYSPPSSPSGKAI